MALRLFRLQKSRAKTNGRGGSNVCVSCISSLFTDKERGFEDINRNVRFNSGYHNLNVLAYTRRYVSLPHTAKILIIKFESDFITTTLEAQPEWDCNVPVSTKQTEGLDIYCAVLGHSSGEGGTAHEDRERTAGKEIEGRTRHFPNTVPCITGRLCRGAR